MWLCVQRLLAWAAPGRVVPPSPTTSSSPRRMRNHLPGMLRRMIAFLAGSPGKTAHPGRQKKFAGTPDHCTVMLIEPLWPLVVNMLAGAARLLPASGPGAAARINRIALRAKGADSVTPSINSGQALRPPRDSAQWPYEMGDDAPPPPTTTSRKPKRLLRWAGVRS